MSVMCDKTGYGEWEPVYLDVTTCKLRDLGPCAGLSMSAGRVYAVIGYAWEEYA